MHHTLRAAQDASPTLLLALVLVAACGPTDDAGGGEALEEANPAAEASAASGAFVDGPDLWLATLEYGENGVPTLGDGRNITRRAGYDNQPNFLPDGSILYTRGVDDRTDIWRYDPATDRHSAVTETPDRSEYSPTPTPDGTGFSAIVVEPDSAQRLWRFDLDGTNGVPIFEDIAPVGYHAWANDSTILMFVLGEPATLERAVVRGYPTSGTSEQVHEGVGRSLNRVPGREAVSFSPAQPTDCRDVYVWSENSIDGFACDPSIPQDHAWIDADWLVHGSGLHPHRLLARTDSGPPHTIGALPDTSMVISRLAVSDDGTSIVLVVDRPRN